MTFLKKNTLTLSDLPILSQFFTERGLCWDQVAMEMIRWSCVTRHVFIIIIKAYCSNYHEQMISLYSL